MGIAESYTHSKTSRRGDTDMATKKTSHKAAQAASKVLRDPKSTKTEKTAAASALSQVEKRKR